jgi:hypothetical protein
MIRPPSSSHSEGESRGSGKTFRSLFLLVATGLTLGWPLGHQASDLFLQRYDFSKDGGSRHTLARALEEISGLTLTPEGHLLAHDDERAVVYQIDPRDGTS